MRDRLIELIGKGLLDYASWSTEMILAGSYDMPSIEEVIADKIIKDGWYRLPCKVGDAIYILSNETLIKSEVVKVKYEEEAENHGKFLRERIYAVVGNVLQEFSFSDMGETVFSSVEEFTKKYLDTTDLEKVVEHLTKYKELKEAEQALKGGEG